MVSNNGELFHLDTKSLVWSQKAKHLRDISYDFSVAACRGKLLLSCGWKIACSVYTVDLDTWITCNPPHVKHCDGQLVWINDSFLLLGGINTDVVEEYNIRSNTWKKAEFKCPLKNYNFHAFAVEMPE